MKNVYIAMEQERDYYNEYSHTYISDVFNSRKRAFEYIMEKFKGSVFEYDGMTDEYIREEPDRELTRAMWIQECEVKS